MGKILELSSISAGYDSDIILSNVNLQVFEQDFIGVIGPNGGGKTTLLRVILGLIKPFSGTIKYFDNGIVQNKLTIGYLPQINSFDARFPISVIDVVVSGLMSKRKLLFPYQKSDYQKAEDLLELTGIKHLKNKPIGELSGGQKQRVFLCRAIISSPSVLILDEPDSYVDSNFEHELYEILADLNKTMAIILVSHDVGIISSLVKTIACVNRNLHYHPSNKITDEILKGYNCPIELITHGKVPHRVLPTHDAN